MSKNQNVINRFFDKVDLDESTGCWNFTSSIGKSNCGRFYYNHKCWDAYVVGYILLGGEIPESYDLHHICRNRLCVNPEHLQPVSRCHEAFNAPTQVVFHVMCLKAEVYGAAIKDICGLSVWTYIVMEADLSFPEETETCCGVPFKSKNSQ